MSARSGSKTQARQKHQIPPVEVHRALGLGLFKSAWWSSKMGFRDAVGDHMQPALSALGTGPGGIAGLLFGVQVGAFGVLCIGNGRADLAQSVAIEASSMVSTGWGSAIRC